MKKFILIPLILIVSCSNPFSNKVSSNTSSITKDISNFEKNVENPKEKQDSIKTKCIKNNTNKDYLTGKISFSNDARFIKLESKLCDGRVIFIRKEVAEAFKKMREAALKDGVTLYVISGSRTFQQQKNIWERKWKIYNNLKPKDRLLKILTFSSMPMSSRHHWGTDIDLNSLDNDYFENGTGLKIYKWLINNASNYGFCQVYSDKCNGRTGYEMEKWHWSYMPISSLLLEEYNKIMCYDDFIGFSGSECTKDVKIIEYYVNGIENQCN